MKTEEKNNETKRDQNEKRNCLQNCFHLFEYVMDHVNGKSLLFLLRK